MAHAARARRAPTSSTSRAARSTTSGCGGSPATGAGACPRRASCGWARTASRRAGPEPSCGRSPPRRRSTRSWAWPRCRPSCARTAARSRRRSRGRLPRLIELADLRGDCHAHSDWSDGIHAIEPMAEAARARGYAYLVLTDHSHGLAIARGLTPERVLDAARDRRTAATQRFAREEDAGHGARGHPAGGLPAPPRLRAGDPGRRQRSTSTTSSSPGSTSSSPRSTRAAASRARS